MLLASLIQNSKNTQPSSQPFMYYAHKEHVATLGLHLLYPWEQLNISPLLQTFVG